MSYLKRLTIVGVSLSFLLLVGCEEAAETTKKVTEEVEEAVQAEVTKDNEFVLSVKEGSLSSHPDVKVKDAFDTFFSSPTWKYLQAETGEHVVEFTGYCTYMEQKVKAKLQFIVEEGKESFEIGALAFNDVPQNDFTIAALIEAVYEGGDPSTSQIENESTGTTQSPQQEEVVNNNEEVTSTNELVQQQTIVSKRNEYIQKLDNIEASLADLDYLYENGITSEMKEAESITYKRWDDALNEVYGVLKTQLSTNEMEALTQEQRQWITDRDNTATAESLEFAGGTMESLQYLSTQARMTKERCYELVNVYME